MAKIMHYDFGRPWWGHPIVNAIISGVSVGGLAYATGIEDGKKKKRTDVKGGEDVEIRALGKKRNERYWLGKVGDFRVYTRALSDGVIERIREETRP